MGEFFHEKVRKSVEVFGCVSRVGGVGSRGTGVSGGVSVDFVVGLVCFSTYLDVRHGYAAVLQLLDGHERLRELLVLRGRVRRKGEERVRNGTAVRERYSARGSRGARETVRACRR